MHALAYAFASAVDARDYHCRFHSLRVSEITAAMTRLMPIGDDLEEEIHLGAHLHDIGKVFVADVVVQKPGRFDEHDCWEMQQHPEAGYRIVRRAGLSKVVLNIVLYHHERFDGKGYPKGLAGKDIPREARLVSLADALDAMVSGRQYNRSVPLETALCEMDACAGSQFDPDLLEVLMSVDPRVLEKLFRTWDAECRDARI